ncbi:hypothetical protein BJ741DRAFT_587709 [Chytriomyces cf. hyalinus JEL632]|nr:hypothetical protein BJ741DRAFT_587709 [Chytriomyces cf. hyalinus JEL632]
MTATKTHDVNYTPKPSIFVTRHPQDQDPPPPGSQATDKQQPHFNAFRRFESAIQIPRKSMSLVANLHSPFAHMDYDTMDAVVDCGIFGKRPFPGFEKRSSVRSQEAKASNERRVSFSSMDGLKQRPDSAAFMANEKVKLNALECMESTCTLNASLEEGLSL